MSNIDSFFLPLGSSLPFIQKQFRKEVNLPLDFWMGLLTQLKINESIQSPVWCLLSIKCTEIHAGNFY